MHFIHKSASSALYGEYREARGGELSVSRRPMPARKHASLAAADLWCAQSAQAMRRGESILVVRWLEGSAMRTFLRALEFKRLRRDTVAQPAAKGSLIDRSCSHLDLPRRVGGGGGAIL